VGRASDWTGWELPRVFAGVLALNSSREVSLNTRPIHGSLVESALPKIRDGKNGCFGYVPLRGATGADESVRDTIVISTLEHGQQLGSLITAMPNSRLCRV